MATVSSHTADRVKDFGVALDRSSTVEGYTVNFVSIREAMMAQCSAPPSEPANNAFFRLRVMGRMARATASLSSSIRPSSMKRGSLSQRDRV